MHAFTTTSPAVEIVQAVIDSECHKAILRVAALAPAEHRFTASALGGALSFLTTGALQAQAAVLQDDGLSVLLQCMQRFFPERLTHPVRTIVTAHSPVICPTPHPLQRAWQSALQLLQSVMGPDSSALQAAVKYMPEGLPLLSSCLEMAGGSSMHPLLLKHFSAKLGSASEGMSRCAYGVQVHCVYEARL